MAYQKKTKRNLTFLEKAWIEEKLNAHKKWVKPLKGQFVFKREGYDQECVIKASYSTEKDIIEDARRTVEHMNKLDQTAKWVLVSTSVLDKGNSNEIDDEV